MLKADIVSGLSCGGGVQILIFAVARVAENDDAIWLVFKDVLHLQLLGFLVFCNRKLLNKRFVLQVDAEQDGQSNTNRTHDLGLEVGKLTRVDLLGRLRTPPKVQVKVDGVGHYEDGCSEAEVDAEVGHAGNSNDYVDHEYGPDVVVQIYGFDLVAFF